MYVKGVGMAYSNATFFRTKHNNIKVSFEGFTGTLDEFRIWTQEQYPAVYKNELLAMIIMAKAHFDINIKGELNNGTHNSTR